MKRVKVEDHDCKTCLLPHDDEIHEATVRIHEWFREMVLLGWRVKLEHDASKAVGGAAARAREEAIAG
jgi:hypothetical protein